MMPEDRLFPLLNQLYLVAKSSGCRCDFQRTGSGVPQWFPDSGGGIGRKLVRLCARCQAIAAYEIQFPPVAA